MASADIDAFLILGHGQEDVVDFEERPILPAGYTLITIAECGIITLEEDVCPLVEAFSQDINRPVFLNPNAHKSSIEGFMRGKPIHIYRAGMKYPKLEIQFFLDWPTERNTKIMKSGTYKFPLSAADFQIGTGSTFSEKMFKMIGPYIGFMKNLPADFDAKLMFDGSILPTTTTVVSEIEKNKSSGTLKSKLTIPLEDVLRVGGPGVYYYVVCRSPRLVKSPRNLVDTDYGLNEKRYEPYFISDWPSKLDEIITLLKENVKTKNYWVKNEINKTIKNYESLRIVPLIRQASLNQQRGVASNAGAAAGAATAGGRRKTRKRRISHKRK